MCSEVCWCSSVGEEIIDYDLAGSMRSATCSKKKKSRRYRDGAHLWLLYLLRGTYKGLFYRR